MTSDPICERGLIEGQIGYQLGFAFYGMLPKRGRRRGERKTK